MLVPESVTLSATLHAIDDERFRCSKCPETRRTGKYCEKSSENVIFKLGNLGFRKCPGNWFSFSALNLIEMQSLFEQGVMPYPGALADQPNKIIEVFRQIASHKAEIKEKRMREAELRAKSRGARG